jgi:hypothetical protein
MRAAWCLRGESTRVVADVIIFANAAVIFLRACLFARMLAWSAGAVWRSTSFELVLAANNSGRPPTYRRQKVTREWTVHFVNGPFQEMYLSEAQVVEDGSGPVCREAAGCGVRDELNYCALLQEELDALGQQLRDGHYHNLIHLNGHEERKAIDLCPCTCAAAASTDDAVEQHLDALVENVTALLRNDSAQVRTTQSERTRTAVGGFVGWCV